MMHLLVTAHTGCNGTPQNTVESVLAGAEWGADLNEIDVRATSDGVPILWHEVTLHSRSGDSLLVENLTYAEILNLEKKKEIDFIYPQGRITRLEEVFDAVGSRDIRLNLDLKDDKCIVPVAKLVKGRDLAERVIFSGCEKVRASYLKSNNSEFQVLLNAEERLFSRDSLTYPEKMRILCDAAVSAGCCGLNIRHDLCRPELVEYSYSRFLPVAVWTVEPEDGFEKYIDMGVASITTRHVQELLILTRDRLTD
ncbi:MAG: hypothetical protein DRP70_13195 [Spirochaetes bacterium]|nr:MAG: hypothetical protein DRP49_07335 [Spirochaetota bacterium]RKX77170.1 MAG: hypothetical protein DRP60_06740 [Spirochaetota bacterium]RKX84466.1 MAG: hypothetical protein DRP70_13195 [Spirochaetota bacterium]RKX95555.1 MAG: hypothetical protein DRZ90_10105 [Spirochaetota bacterium]